jgi:hypothetical protein
MGLVLGLVLGLALAALVAACSLGAVPGVAPTPIPTTAAPSTSAALPTSAPDEPTPVGTADEVRVTLGIYSGRADPTWTLAGAEAAAVERAIQALPEAAGSPPEGGLGYHGFTVTRGGSNLTAYLGAVWAGGGGPQVIRRDPERTVERLLLELGRTELTPEEIAEVERSLDAAP